MVKRISLTHESSRLLLVYVGFCCDKHTAVAVVPAEVWEEDGGFLRYHSECTVVISVRPHFDVCAILWTMLGKMHHCLDHRRTLFV